MNINLNVEQGRQIIRRGKDNVAICLVATFPFIFFSMYCQCWYFLIHPALCLIIAALNLYTIDCYIKGKNTKFKL